MSKILVTGANGYVGKYLGQLLATQGYNSVGSVRNLNQNKVGPYSQLFSSGDISGETNWAKSLINIDCIIHLAARVHILSGTKMNSIEKFRTVNTKGTINLAQQAAKAGVRRFIYISSIGVLGNKTHMAPFTNESAPHPVENYAISKYEAEQALIGIMGQYKMEIVIVRPPIVYGHKAPGNFARLFKLVKLGLPLPFGKMNGKKSMISIHNLCDFLIRCIDEPSAKNKSFVVSDGEDLSTRELIELMATSLNKQIILLPVPLTILKGICYLFGQEKVIDKLSNELLVDSRTTNACLNWFPPFDPKKSFGPIKYK